MDGGGSDRGEQDHQQNERQPCKQHGEHDSSRQPGTPGRSISTGAVGRPFYSWRDAGALGLRAFRFHGSIVAPGRPRHRARSDSLGVQSGKRCL